jgi:hypothetical protein
MSETNPLEDLVGLNQLEIYTEALKAYLKEKGITLTQDDVQQMIDTSESKYLGNDGCLYSNSKRVITEVITTNATEPEGLVVNDQWLCPYDDEVDDEQIIIKSSEINPEY